MKSRNIGLAVLTAAVFGLGVFAWYDTAPHRAALADLAQYKGQMEARIVNINQDTDALQKCTHLDGAGLQYSEKERSCLIEGMNTLKTYEGAYVFTRIAHTWLLEKPDDEDVRKAALLAIKIGRDELLAIKPWAFDKQQAVYSTHDRSVLMSIRHGQFNMQNLFKGYSRWMDEAEVSVRMPELAKSQDDWFNNALLGKTSETAKQ